MLPRSAAGYVQRRLVHVGGGPSRLALDERRDRLYVLNRFEQTMSIVEGRLRGRRAPVGARPSALGFDPSPPAVTQGRRFLFDPAVGARRRRVRQLSRVRATSTVSHGTSVIPTVRSQPIANPLPERPAAPLASHEGPDDHANPSRPGRRGTDALARRSDRCSRGRQSVRQRRRVQTVQPGVRQLAGSTRQLGVGEMQAFADWRRRPLPPQPVARLDGVLDSRHTRSRRSTLPTSAAFATRSRWGRLVFRSIS